MIEIKDLAGRRAPSWGGRWWNGWVCGKTEAPGLKLTAPESDYSSEAALKTRFNHMI